MLTFVVSSILFLLLVYLCWKPKGLPPGRWGLPIIGYYPLYTKDLTQIVEDMKKQFGDVFTWKLGSANTVVLCNPRIIKTVFSMPQCQGRPHQYGLHIYNFSSNIGLVRSTGHIWSESRRFSLRHLRDLGMGKSSMENIILHEAVILTKSYEDTAGKPTDFMYNINVAVLNVIWKLVADKRYDMDGEEIRKIYKLFSQDIDIIQGSMALLDVFPILRKILPNAILNRWMKLDVLHHHLDEFKGFFMEIVNEHVATFDPMNIRDYIDAYLKEIQDEKGNPNTVFKDDYLNLVACIASFFRAGSETTSSTTRWMVALLANHPEVQERVHREIDEVIPRNQVPSLQDKEKMPYTEAMLLEVMRASSMVPFGITHANTEDISIEGYHIPKGTQLCAASVSCHRDPRYWEKPYDFYPEHFLDENGKVVTKKEGFLPFSLGRRQCLGENLARMEVFLFATCLLQKLSMAPPKGEIINAEADKSNFFLHTVKPYKVVFTRRNDVPAA